MRYILLSFFISIFSVCGSVSYSMDVTTTDPSIVSLPGEVIDRNIIPSLRYSDINSLKNTCPHFNNLIKFPSDSVYVYFEEEYPKDLMIKIGIKINRDYIDRYCAIATVCHLQPHYVYIEGIMKQFDLSTAFYAGLQNNRNLTSLGFHNNDLNV